MEKTHMVAGSTIAWAASGNRLSSLTVLRYIKE